MLVFAPDAGWKTILSLAPGLALSAAVAIASVLMAPMLPRVLPIPAMVITLLLGMALNPWARAKMFQPGMRLCVNTLLRWAVALLGLRIALGDILALGLATACLVAVAMALTMVFGFALARLLGQSRGYGALAGAACAVCGASAALATSTMLPHYDRKEIDVAFVIVGVNALATVAMLIYPLLCYTLDLDYRLSGVLLGGTIHDVAQVVGAGYARSEASGNVAVIVKLFRVFLLLPVVMVVRWYFDRIGIPAKRGHVPFPTFALAFLALCIFNSIVPVFPDWASAYAPIKDVLVGVSNWGLLLAIGALGLGTSFAALAKIGWRHIVTLIGTTAVILIVVTGGLILIRMVQ